ncbi:hypothetical protein SAMN05444411_103177 [Lutibacter oricola]|uniref:Secreted protein n=1 Tax=Lutibacter oricola TaxID=762486 RepID=A0A1H2Z8N6_9FLAO|nr:hypothetical protein [Lutibacter oricola]SDX13770.1 hypothetical protein SAMN05444411_103177 [Lutibacter oricola]
MNTFQKNIILLVIVTFVTSFGYSQTKKFDNATTGTKSTNQFQAKTSTKKITPNNTNFNFNLDTKIDKKAIANTINKTKSEDHSGFLLEERPEDKDIIGRKYLNNKDVTHQKLKSSMSLGTISTDSKVIRVECRDHAAIDGDIIKIYLNEKHIGSSVALKASSFVFYVTLEKGYNRIDFQAMNQGMAGANTAELRVYDEKGNQLSAKNWYLTTNATATIGVIQKQ